VTKRRRWLLAGGLLLPPLALIAALAWQVLSQPLVEPAASSVAWLDRSGRLMHIFQNVEQRYRLVLPLADFPPRLVEAVLLQEDRFFYGHGGVNLAALWRAFDETFIKRHRRVGASTITMQVARLSYRLRTRTIPGKLWQIGLAIAMEAFYTKQEILEAYLNLAPLGGNIEGYGTAAWYYFGRPARDLTLSELLLLAVVPQNPVARAPLDRSVPSDSLAARQALYTAWLEQHPEDAPYASAMELAPAILGRFPYRALHFNEYLRLNPEQAPRRAGAPEGGARTSLDLGLQTLCEERLAAYITSNRGWGLNNAAVLLVDHTSLEVLATIGSADYYDSAIQGMVNGAAARRSPGSTLKPFIYALAIDQGLIHPETMLRDSPLTFSEYTPDNYHGEFKGPVKAWRALTDSRNIPAIYLAERLNEPDLYGLLEGAGVPKLKGRDHYGLSLVLGSAELSMMKLAELYAGLANQGTLRPLRFVPADTETGPAPAPVSRPQLCSPAAAWVTLRMLERNPAPDATRPSESRAVPVAYKTGTSIGFKDGWAVSVFDRYVLCVWVGNFSGEGNSAFVGRLMAAPLMFGIIDALLQRLPAGQALPTPRPPEGVSRVAVCAVSGSLPGPHCQRLIETWFLPGVSPIATCVIHRQVHIDTRTGYRSASASGPHIRSEVREFWPSDLLSLFERAGLPRLPPPPWPPDEDGQTGQPDGFPPTILSPLANTTYIIPPTTARYRQLVLVASADADAGELFWFANSEFLGRAAPSASLLWEPEPGAYDLTVADARGRSASCRLSVSATPPPAEP